MGVDPSETEQIIANIVDPELGLAIGQVGIVNSIKVKRHHLLVKLSSPIAAWPSKEAIEEQIRAVASGLGDIKDVSLEWAVMGDEEGAELRRILRRAMTTSTSDLAKAENAVGAGHDATSGARDVDGHGHGHDGHGHEALAETPAFLQPGSATRVIGVSSGKGGVGKSSVTTNLAVALARSGYSVGVLDADVYGFSIPKMLGADRDPLILGDIVIPTEALGVRCLSMGFFVPDDQPVIWRGPMLHKAIEQFLNDAYWATPDFLLVDMPPGTGDVTLSLAQVMPRAEIIVVTTPQPAAQRVAQRSAFAARKLKLSVRGVVENMSWFTGDDSKRYELFGSGGGAALAKDLSVPLIGQIPLLPALREGCDVGLPIVISHPDSEAAIAIFALAERLVKLGPARVYRRELTLR